MAAFCKVELHLYCYSKLCFQLYAPGEFIYIYMCIYMYMRVYMYIYTYTWVYTYINIHVCAYTYTHVRRKIIEILFILAKYWKLPNVHPEEK